MNHQPTRREANQPFEAGPEVEVRFRLTTKSSVGLPVAELRELVVAEGALSHQENGPSDGRVRPSRNFDQ